MSATRPSELGEPSGSEYRSFLSLVPPGRYRTEVAGGWGAMMARPAVELAFTDRAGVHWLRSGDGTLTEITKPAAEHYGMGEPQDWRTPSEGPSAERPPSTESPLSGRRRGLGRYLSRLLPWSRGEPEPA